MASASARRTPAAVPGYEDAIKRQALSLNIRNDEHGPAGVEERCLDEEPLERRRVRLRLTHDRQIEPPRDLGENVAGALATGTSSMWDLAETAAPRAASSNAAMAAFARFSFSARCESITSAGKPYLSVRGTSGS
jgi:hypothetical protein